MCSVDTYRWGWNPPNVHPGDVSDLSRLAELTSKDHSATHAILNNRIVFQDVHLPPSNAVLPSAGTNGYWPARKGRTTFPFSCTLPADAPSSITFARNGAVQYVIKASVEVWYEHSKSSVVTQCEADVVELWPDASDPVWRCPVEAVGETRLFMGGQGTVWLEAALDSQLFPAGSSVPVRIGVKNASKRDITGLRLEVERTLTLPIEGPTSPQITEIVHTQHFAGKTADFPAGCELVLDYVLELPRTLRTVARKTRLIHVTVTVVAVLEMGTFAKELRVRLPISVTHPLSLRFDQLSNASLEAAVPSPHGWTIMDYAQRQQQQYPQQLPQAPPHHQHQQRPHHTQNDHHHGYQHRHLQDHQQPIVSAHQDTAEYEVPEPPAELYNPHRHPHDQQLCLDPEEQQPDRWARLGHQKGHQLERMPSSPTLCGDASLPMQHLCTDANLEGGPPSADGNQWQTVQSMQRVPMTKLHSAIDQPVQTSAQSGSEQLCVGSAPPLRARTPLNAIRENVRPASRASSVQKPSTESPPAKGACARVEQIVPGASAIDSTVSEHVPQTGTTKLVNDDRSESLGHETPSKLQEAEAKESANLAAVTLGASTTDRGPHMVSPPTPPKPVKPAAIRGRAVPRPSSARVPLKNNSATQRNEMETGTQASSKVALTRSESRVASTAAFFTALSEGADAPQPSPRVAVKGRKQRQVETSSKGVEPVVEASRDAAQSDVASAAVRPGRLISVQAQSAVAISPPKRIATASRAVERRAAIPFLNTTTPRVHLSIATRPSASRDKSAHMQETNRVSPRGTPPAMSGRGTTKAVGKDRLHELRSLFGAPPSS